ncbi:glycosyltransferase [Nonomuraea fuscirosea]|jgi:glycosyltransferase involved in cell wall biosynthesis|uniref:glycosyltransferase family 2 protein n=1 Tax=Nonomuraea fuscirosea TaxID=1291556 RepID=UPI002DD86B36|nr:glycosyltransferase [Nonomuraea fuscirosea]WSA52814.1 glycosyltransferase [Nonomuraea fuscirosea]
MTPSVGVVVPTRGDRPGPLREAVAAVLAQDHAGRLDVVVVADGVSPREVSRQLAGRAYEWGAGQVGLREAGQAGGQPAGGWEAVRVLANTRTPGLPGARNTGIDACDTDLIAFCDDDDVWLPGKLAAQLHALRDGGEFASCGIEVEHRGHRVARLAGASVVTAADLIRSRMVMVHSSTFLFRRGELRPDESAPAGQNEDWDLALRAAKRRPLVHADRPLVLVRWAGSHYAARWADRIAGLEWMLARHPELAVDPCGAARVYGQLAFGHAALGRRRAAVRWAARAFAARPREPRGPIALAVAAGLVSAPRVLSALHHRGHGI